MSDTIPRQISNRDLVASKLPHVEGAWDEIARFALTFDGYKQFGEVADLARLDEQGRCGTLSEIRARLFFKQRKHRWNQTEPEAAEAGEVRELMAQLRDRVELANLLLA